MRVKPAYLKPKDAITATRMVRRAAGFGELGQGAAPMSPMDRYNAIVADMTRRPERGRFSTLDHGSSREDTDEFVDRRRLTPSRTDANSSLPISHTGPQSV